MTIKLVLSGITGRIGSQVLKQALRNPAISSVIALSRRQLPDIEGHGKLEVVLIQDFTRYSDEVLVKLSGADGCIW
jgi:dihydrodipicolinate reductase